jgi:ABC-2 type transport system ATP-binding protein
VIRTEGLTKHFGDVVAVDDVSLQVEAGEVFGFLGPNGAGKSTTLRLLLGLIRPTSGAAWLSGVPVGDVRRAHRSVSYVPGDVSLWPHLTGAETLELLGNVAGGVDRDFRDELVERFSLDVSKRARAYSKGNRQKVALVAAFMTRPDLLLLDEPTAGLDPLMEVVFRETVHEARERGQTVFLSSHVLSEVEALCDRVGILRDGRLVDEGTLAELRHLSAHTVEVTFEGHPPSIDGLPGVSAAPAGENAVRYEVTGSVGPLIAALAEHPVVSLTSREPSLEEIFLHHYDAVDGGGGD